MPADLIRLLMLAALLAAFAPPASAEPYKVAVNHAPPYRIIEKTPTQVGYSGIYVDVVKALADRSGIAIEFEEVPFKRALVMMELGAADLMLGPNRVPERERFMAFLDVELTRDDKVFYIAVGGADIAAYDDLAGRAIAVLRGSTYFDRFDDDAALHKVELANYLTALRIVELGRVDAAIVPELLGDSLIRDHGLRLGKASYVVEGRPSFIAVSRKSALLGRVEELEGALREIKDDGTLEDILARYARLRNRDYPMGPPGAGGGSGSAAPGGD